MFNKSEEKKDPTKNLKHRDLLNPNKQKRKHAGVKLTTPIWQAFKNHFVKANDFVSFMSQLFKSQ